MLKCYLAIAHDGEVLTVLADFEERLHEWDPHTSRFHASWPFEVDFFAEQECQYQPLNESDVLNMINSGVGKYDVEEMADLLAEHQADTKALTLQQVLDL